MAEHRKSYRLRFTFWLDVMKNTEAELAEQIENLKAKRSFASYIRDGLRLIIDLKQGKTDVLNELFPWVFESQNKALTVVEEQPTKDNTKPDAISEQLKRLEELITKQGATPLSLPARKASPNDGLDDDFELEIKSATRSEDSNATWNFLISSALNVYGTISGLPPEVIEYGIRTKRIPEHMQKPKGPKKMKVPDVAPPSFDDIGLEL